MKGILGKALRIHAGLLAWFVLCNFALAQKPSNDDNSLTLEFSTELPEEEPGKFAAPKPPPPDPAIETHQTDLERRVQELEKMFRNLKGH